MTIQLTEQQQQALDAERTVPARVLDPRTNAAYFLVPEKEYAALREALEEERRQQIIHAIGLRNAAGRMEENS